jgi:hypothetical protein
MEGKAFGNDCIAPDRFMCWDLHGRSPADNGRAGTWNSLMELWQTNCVPLNVDFTVGVGFACHNALEETPRGLLYLKLCSLHPKHPTFHSAAFMQRTVGEYCISMRTFQFMHADTDSLTWWLPWNESVLSTTLSSFKTLHRSVMLCACVPQVSR